MKRVVNNFKRHFRNRHALNNTLKRKPALVYFTWYGMWRGKSGTNPSSLATAHLSKQYGLRKTYTMQFPRYEMCHRNLNVNLCPILRFHYSQFSGATNLPQPS